MTNANDRKQIQDYYKMLLFLNESTSDFFFLWDIREKKFHFARELNIARESTGDDVCTYTMDDLQAVAYPDDCKMILRQLGNVADGNEETMDFDFRYLDSYGKKNWINARGKVLKNHKHQPFVVMGCLSRRVLAEKVDMLTGLLNYNKMLDNLNSKIARGHRGHLIVLGIDGFRDVNQRMGREYGNHVLIRSAEILEGLKGEKNTVYRLDGDHFAVDLVGYNKKDAEDFYALVKEKTAALCSFSAGIVSYPFEKEKDANILISYAENALGRAKETGRNRMEYFSSEDYNKTLSRIELQQEMKESIRNNFEGFELYYQPQVTSNEYKLHGAEALLRYRSRKFGFMSPVVFIPILEKSGMIVPVGKWVMQQAFAQCARWRKLQEDFSISINASYVQLREASIVNDVVEAAREAGLPGRNITVEVTESMQLQDYNYFNNIFSNWRNKEIHVSIDDFGTGYSSLSYLKGLEVDEVKIDRCFIRQIQKSAYNYRLLSNMLELTHSARIRVCCEGVEDEEELHCLDTLFPELIQGFLFGRPMSAQEFEYTCLIPNDAYMQLIRRLTEYNEKERLHKECTGQTAISEQFECRKILDQLEEIVYLVDTESQEIYFMNSAAKKLTGVYNYFGSKYSQIFAGDVREISGNSMEKEENGSYLTEKMLYEKYGRLLRVRERAMTYNGRPAVMVVAWPVEGESRQQDRRVRDELYGLNQTLELYELAFRKKHQPELIQEILDFTGHYYQSSRVCLFLYDSRMDIWQDVYSYLEKGVMDKKRFLKLTAGDSMRPWAKLLEEKHAVFIRSAEELKEKDQILWNGFMLQDIYNCMLCSICDQNHKVVGLVSVDNADYCRDDLFLLKKAGRLLENVLFCQNEKTDMTERLHRYVEKTLDHNILSATLIGLWSIKINKDSGQVVMLADDNMHLLIEADKDASPAQCYRNWFENIHPDYIHYIHNVMDTIITTGQTVEASYPWRHSERGWVNVRCVGVKTSETDRIITIEGYHRLIDDLQQMKAVPDSGYTTQ